MTQPDVPADSNARPSTSDVPLWTPLPTAVSGPPTNSGPNSGLNSGLNSPPVATAPSQTAVYALAGHPLRNAFWAVVTLVVMTLITAEGLDRIAGDFRDGSTAAFIASAASLLLTDVLIIVVLFTFATRAGVTTRHFGLTTPTDKAQAAILAAATWLVFLLAAGIWITVTTNAEDLRAQSNALTRPQAKAPNADDSRPGSSSVAEEGADGAEEAADFEDNRHVLIKVLQDDPPRRTVILLVISVCLLAPLLEELFFRGYLFVAVASKVGPHAAAVATGLLFGLAHVSAVPLKILPVLATLGIGLGWLRHQTGSIVPGIGVHAFVNSLATGVSAGFGIHTVTLILGAWVTLLLLVSPFLRRNRPDLGTA